MGVDLNCAQLLIRAKIGGVSFERMATLGRQSLHANRPALISVLLKSGFKLPRDLKSKLLDPTTTYCEDFFALLGARQITAIDASAYEGAQIIHDMNLPIPESLASSYDLVLDGGTLEHVFDFPTGIRNALQMVSLNGTFISLTMANNFCGHGFYQFSPELFHRLLCRENGYSLESCIMWEEIQGSGFFRIPDPRNKNSRIELTSKSGTLLFIQGRRTGRVSREYIPLQSDYVANWERANHGSPQRQGSNAVRGTLKRISFLRSVVRIGRELTRSSFLRAHYTELEYRNRRLNLNSRRVLERIQDMKVLL